MPLMADSSTNWSFHALAAAYGLAATPMIYCFGSLTLASNGRVNNAMPRLALENLKGRIPQPIWEQCFRARATHLNALEHFPLFVATVVAGNLAGLPVQEINGFAGEYLLLRSLYTVLYIKTTSNRWSYLRSAVWFGCTGLCMWTLLRAGVALDMSKRL